MNSSLHAGPALADRWTNRPGRKHTYFHSAGLGVSAIRFVVPGEAEHHSLAYKNAWIWSKLNSSAGMHADGQFLNAVFFPGSSCVGIPPLLQAHLALEKTPDFNRQMDGVFLTVLVIRVKGNLLFKELIHVEPSIESSWCSRTDA